MNHMGTINIETKRLVLRRFEKGDEAYIFRNWARDPEVSRYLTWPAHTDIAVSKKILDTWLEAYESPLYYNWAIVPKDIKEPVGSISVVNICKESSKCEIGYCLGRKFWGKGIMTEALVSVIGFLFNVVGFNRIQAYHHKDNPASGRVMMKAGMRKEGSMREYAVNNKGGFVDVDFYGILRSDLD